MTKHASFWYRLLAWFLDLSAMLLITSFSFYLISQTRSLQEALTGLLIYLAIILAPLWFLNPILFVQFFNGSIGKLLCGLRVLSENGTKLNLKRNFFRHTLGYLFSWTFFGLGYLCVLKDKQRQAWHDKAVKSQVVIAQSIWILGLILLTALISLNIYLFSQSVQNFLNTPFLKLDIGRYIQATQMEFVIPEATNSSLPQNLYSLPESTPSTTPF